MKFTHFYNYLIDTGVSALLSLNKTVNPVLLDQIDAGSRLFIRPTTVWTLIQRSRRKGCVGFLSLNARLLSRTPDCSAAHKEFDHAVPRLAGLVPS